MTSKRVKLFAAAGAIGIGVVVAARYYYSRRQRQKQDETDEGIGDEDSIISDSENDASVFSTLNQAMDVTVDQVGGRENSHISFVNSHQHSSLKTDEVSLKPMQTENQESSDSEAGNPKKVLILGLDRSGKTALVETLTKHQDRNPDLYKPTNGFNVAQARCDGVLLNIMEVGGGCGTRKYWPNFLQDTDALVYVLDASDPARFEEARGALGKILAEPQLSQVPCLLLANKQDVAGAVTCQKIISEKDLAKLSTNRHLKLTLLDSVCVPSSSNVVEYSDTLMAVILNVLE